MGCFLGILAAEFSAISIVQEEAEAAAHATLANVSEVTTESVQPGTWVTQ